MNNRFVYSAGYWELKGLTSRDGWNVQHAWGE
jgi:hypothetical protein